MQVYIHPMDAPSTNQVEPRTDTAPPRPHGISVWLLWLLAIPLFYLLGVGPAYRLSGSGVIPDSTVWTIYAPLLSFCKGHPTAAHCYHWYLRLWGVPYRTNHGKPVLIASARG
jgi:hypothetical protein